LNAFRLISLLIAGNCAAQALLPKHPMNMIYLKDLGSHQIDAFDFDSTKVTKLKALCGWQDDGMRFTAGLNVKLASQIHTEMWVDGLKSANGEALMGTSLSRSEMTGRIQHATLLWNGNIGLLEIGRRSLNQGWNGIDDVIWNQHVPGVDMVRYQLRAGKYSLKLDVLAGQLNWDEDPLVKRWYSSHRITWRSPRDTRNHVVIGDQAVLAGHHRSFELQMLNPLLPTLMDNFEGSRESFADSAYLGDSHMLFAVASWHPKWTQNTRVYGMLAVDEFQIDKKDRQQLDDVYGLLVGVEHEWYHRSWLLSLGAEWTAVTPWMYVHRGRPSSFSSNGKAIGSISGNDAKSLALYGCLVPRSELFIQAWWRMSEIGSLSSQWNWGADESNGLNWPTSPSRQTRHGGVGITAEVNDMVNLFFYLER
jgi:hypothetical protein